MRYSAFISYNHRDRKWATRLHRALEQYRVPKRLWGRQAPFGPVAARLPPVFRDRDELASSADLAGSVRAALAEAATLVVICSPNGAKSRWVDEEVRTFIASGRADRILCIIVDGEPHSGDPDTECLPPALREPGGIEPLAADARKDGDGPRIARLKLLAGILDVPFDLLRQREAQRRQRRLALITAASLTGMVVMAALTIAALIARAEAVEQRNIARQRTITAERTLDFVKSMFRVSDPSEARGERITARQVVDRGASLLDTGLGEEPTAKAELGVTLAEVYGALGLFGRSDALIRRSFAIRQPEALTAARQFMVLGESQSRLGDYDKAVRSFDQAARLVPPDERSGLESRILVGIGQARSALGDEAAADRAILRALAIDRARGPAARSDVARDLEAIGLNKFFGGDFAKARPPIERALAIRMEVEGPASPSVADNRNTLSALAHATGDLPRAERYLRTNLTNDERVLGRDHPDLATTLNNLGRILIEQRRFGEAAPLLERAVAINLEHRGARHDDMAFLFANLGFVRRHEGRLAEAEDLFGRSVEVARSTSHRILGPSLADLAELRCARGRTAEGLALIPEARTATDKDYPDDAWRLAWVDTAEAGCIAGADPARARALLNRAVPIILARWPRDTLFGREARQRLQRLARA